MKNLFLLNVSESPECVLDQINNIKKFVSEEEYIVVHISGSTKEQFIKDSQEQGIDLFSMEDQNVFVNPESIETKPGYFLVEAFLSSFEFAKDFDFDKVVLNASNQLYIRSGLKKHLAKYDAGVHSVKANGNFGMFSYQETGAAGSELKDKFMKKIFGEPRFRYWSFHEGSFYAKRYFTAMASVIKQYNKDIAPDKLATSEEQTLPSLFNNAWPNANKTKSTVWMNLFCDLSEIEAIDLIRAGKYSEVQGADMLPQCHQTPPHEYMLCGDFIFGIKRVPREIDSDVRKYIRSLEV